jgi:hypothetical protein
MGRYSFGPSRYVHTIAGAQNANLANVDRMIQQFNNAVSAIAYNLGPESREYQTAINYAGSILRDRLRAKAPSTSRPVYRYEKNSRKKRGEKKIVAVYMPGNLRRSIKVLRHMKDKRNVYVGVEIQPPGQGGGTFSGDRTDGYYVRWLEYNPGTSPFFRNTIASSQSEVMAKLDAYVKKVLEAEWKKMRSYTIDF